MTFFFSNAHYEDLVLESTVAPQYLSPPLSISINEKAIRMKKKRKCTRKICMNILKKCTALLEQSLQWDQPSDLKDRSGLQRAPHVQSQSIKKEISFAKYEIHLTTLPLPSIQYTKKYILKNQSVSPGITQHPLSLTVESRTMETIQIYCFLKMH